MSETKAIGAYFLNPDPSKPLPADGLADVENIMLETPIYYNGATALNETTQIATAYFTPYYYIAPNDGDEIIDYDNNNGEYHIPS